MDRFRKNLRQYMKDTRTTQAALAEALGVSQSAVSAWLSGTKTPSVENLWALADHFATTMDELAGRTD